MTLKRSAGRDPTRKDRLAPALSFLIKQLKPWKTVRSLKR